MNPVDVLKACIRGLEDTAWIYLMMLHVIEHRETVDEDTTTIPHDCKLCQDL
jgi:hypothetical protein